MNPLHEPLTSPRHAGRAPDEIDGLLRAFFRAELPEPWPVLKPPPTEVPTAVIVRRRPHWVMMRSRLALAASIGLLLVGCWLLSGMGSSHPVPDFGQFPDGTAERKKGDSLLLLKEGPEEIIDIDEVKYKMREKVEQPVKPVGQNVKPVGPPTHRYEMVPLPRSGEK